MKEKKCPCGNGCMELKLTQEKTVFKKIELDIESEKYLCPHCGLEASTIDQAGKIQTHIADSYREKTGLLSGMKIKKMRSSAGLTRKHLSVLMNVSPDEIRGWETCVIQSRIDDTAIRKILRESGSYEIV